MSVFVRLFISLFPHCELSYFSPSIYGQWIPREHNSSYNFILIFLERCTCFLHSLKMCMCFSYNPCHIFCHFFFILFELSFTDLRCIDSGYHLIASSHTILCKSACSLEIIFRFIFVFFPLYFFHFLTSDFMKVYRLWVPFERHFSCII